MPCVSECQCYELGTLIRFKFVTKVWTKLLAVGEKNEHFDTSSYEQYINLLLVGCPYNTATLSLIYRHTIYIFRIRQIADSPLKACLGVLPHKHRLGRHTLN